jgi:hypothetical protein
MTRPSHEPANVGGDTSILLRERHQDGQLTRLIAQLGNYALAIVGGVTSIAELVGLVTSSQLRKFVNEYPYCICITLIFTVFALLMSLNYAQTVRRQLQAARPPRELHPSAHDVRLFAETLADLPLDGPVISWLKRVDVMTLDPADFPADVLTALERTVGRLARRPVGFDDDLVAQVLADFLVAVEGYRASLESWTLVRLNLTLAGAAGGLPPVGGDAATVEVADFQARLLRAYDSFILVAHKRGLDVGTG